MGGPWNDIDLKEVGMSMVSGAAAGALTGLGVPPVVTGGIVGAGSNLATQLYDNGGDISQVDPGDVVFSAGTGAVLGGLIGGGRDVNAPHLLSMENAMLKSIGNSLSYQIGKGALNEIGKAIRYYLSQTQTLLGRSAALAFSASLRSSVFDELIDRIINNMMQNTESLS